jgi:hypothetical protein
MSKIKLYRCTVKHSEHVSPKYGNEPIVSYRQTAWSDALTVPGLDCEIVHIEEKVIDVAEKCLRRKSPEEMAEIKRVKKRQKKAEEALDAKFSELINEATAKRDKCSSCGKLRYSSLARMCGESDDCGNTETWTECKFCCSQADYERYFEKP